MFLEAAAAAVRMRYASVIDILEGLLGLEPESCRSGENADKAVIVDDCDSPVERESSKGLASPLLGLLGLSRFFRAFAVVE